MVYVVLACILLGYPAYFSVAHFRLNQPFSDIWQHIAAINALMENLSDPGNPFIATDDPSRHFSLYWVAAAWIGRTFDLDVWSVLRLCTYFSMLVLGTGIYVFSRSYSRSPWFAPVLLVVLLFGWVAPYRHTGMHNFQTLLYAAVYPATLMIGVSFMLWAAVIRGLRSYKFLPAVTFVMLVMFVTHQLGAAIGFAVAGAFAIFHHDVPLRRRVAVVGAMAAGVVLSLGWPYYNPIGLMLASGNSSWSGGPDFYGPPTLPFMLVPIGLALVAMRYTRARALLAAMCILLAIYAVGFVGPQIAGRFLTGAVLIAHIALTEAILAWASRLALRRSTVMSVFVGSAVIVSAAFFYLVRDYEGHFDNLTASSPMHFDSVAELVSDIDDNSTVAAFRYVAWPVAATGTKVHSVPWPEPGIPDLASRQTDTERLFATDQSPEARLELAQSLGIRTLIVDRRNLHSWQEDLLRAHAVASRQVGTVIRLDLY